MCRLMENSPSHASALPAPQRQSCVVFSLALNGAGILKLQEDEKYRKVVFLTNTTLQAVAKHAVVPYALNELTVFLLSNSW